MKIKTQLTFSFFCILMILVPIVNARSASIWYAVDNLDDVMYFDNGVYQSTDAYHDAVDIDRIALEGSNLVFHTVGTPVYSTEYEYVLYVYWYDWPFKIILTNVTSMWFGDGQNYVSTELYFDSVPTTADITDGITIVGNSLVCPIPLFASIQNTTADMFYCSAIYHINKAESDSYFDNLSSTVTLMSPGFVFFITIFSIVFIATIYLIRKKK
jgi:hypothetical protein